jgi:hypothetical protein
MEYIEADAYLSNGDILWAGRVWTEVDKCYLTADYIKLNNKYYIPMEVEDILEVYKGNQEVINYLENWLVKVLEERLV